MSSRSEAFRTPHQVKGTPVATRFGLRPVEKPKKAKQQSIFSYGSPGKGVQGESSN